MSLQSLTPLNTFLAFVQPVQCTANINTSVFADGIIIHSSLVFHIMGQVTLSQGYFQAEIWCFLGIQASQSLLHLLTPNVNIIQCKINLTIFWVDIIDTNKYVLKFYLGLWYTTVKHFQMLQSFRINFQIINFQIAEYIQIRRMEENNKDDNGNW